MPVEVILKPQHATRNIFFTKSLEGETVTKNIQDITISTEVYESEILTPINLAMLAKSHSHSQLLDYSFLIDGGSSMDYQIEENNHTYEQPVSGPSVIVPTAPLSQPQVTEHDEVNHPSNSSESRTKDREHTDGVIFSWSQFLQR